MVSAASLRYKPCAAAGKSQQDMDRRPLKPRSAHTHVYVIHPVVSVLPGASVGRQYIVVFRFPPLPTISNATKCTNGMCVYVCGGAEESQNIKYAHSNKSHKPYCDASKR